MALGVGGGWMWVGGAPHTHAHALTCMHTHACMVNIIISCKWLPPLGESLGIPYDVICTCMCMRLCVHVCRGHPLTTLHPYPPTPYPQGGHLDQSKFNSTWTNRDISILFKDLKSVETSSPTSGCIVFGGLGWWVGSKFKKNCWLNQDNSILFEDLWFVETLPPMGGCGCGWMGG